MKPRIRVPAFKLLLGLGVPDDARHGDLVVGNRGAAALVVCNSRLGILVLEYVGNYYDGVRPQPGCRMYDNRAGHERKG